MFAKLPDNMPLPGDLPCCFHQCRAVLSLMLNINQSNFQTAEGSRVFRVATKHCAILPRCIRIVALLPVSIRLVEHL